MTSAALAAELTLQVLPVLDSGTFVIHATLRLWTPYQGQKPQSAVWARLDHLSWSRNGPGRSPLTHFSVYQHAQWPPGYGHGGTGLAIPPAALPNRPAPGSASGVVSLARPRSPGR